MIQPIHTHALGASPAPSSSRTAAAAANFQSVMQEASAAVESPAPASETSAANETGSTQPLEAPAPPNSTGFAKTEDPRMPHVPRFSSVPDAVKHPLGPYRQAPAEFGGDWWLVNPFSGAEPWLQLEMQAQRNSAPDTVAAEFIQIFGERPQPQGNATHSVEYKTELMRWEQDLQYFKQAGIPEGFSREQVEMATSAFEAWGLGEPMFYEGRYGWRARFSNGYEVNPHTAIETPHLVIAGYQVKMAQEGVASAERHPFVPPGVWNVFNESESQA